MLAVQLDFLSELLCRPSLRIVKPPRDSRRTAGRWSRDILGPAPAVKKVIGELLCQADIAGNQAERRVLPDTSNCRLDVMMSVDGFLAQPVIRFAARSPRPAHKARAARQIFAQSRW